MQRNLDQCMFCSGCPVMPDEDEDEDNGGWRGGIATELAYGF